MITITRTACVWCEGTGHRKHPRDKTYRNRRKTCSKCHGSRCTEQLTSCASVTIGPGWFSDAPMDRERRADVAMLAACLAAKQWPPEA